MRTCAFCLLLAIKFSVGKIITHVPRLPEDAYLDTLGLASKYGHPALVYDVVTEDGYILTLYRLPGRRRIPILLVHGLLDSSDTWLARGNTSLPIALANDGYDIWLANSRGNRHSRRHLYLNPDTDREFWRFSFHEMGCYDLPAIIDTILSMTSAPKLSAIGHSQGNTMFYVLGSERREYNPKINMLIALSPIAYLYNTFPPVSVAIQSFPAIDRFFKKLRIYEVFSDYTVGGQILQTYCPTATGRILCLYGLFFNIFGYDDAELDPQFFPTIATRYPAGGSAQSILHFMQIGYMKRFARYDYGIAANRRIYNSSHPPAYHMARVTMPIALLAGRNDRMSTIRDVATLRKRLPNVVYYLDNPRLLMNHVDYIIGKNMAVYSLPYIYRLLSESDHFAYN